MGRARLTAISVVAIGAIAAAGWIVTSGALRPDRVATSIVFAGRGARALDRVHAVAGGDDHYIGSIAANDGRSFNLFPGPQDDRRLFLSYDLAGTRHEWSGPAVPAGAGYRIRIEIDDSGTATARHCLLPCRL